jgi:hypothetical protein
MAVMQIYYDPKNIEEENKEASIKTKQTIKTDKAIHH